MAEKKSKFSSCRCRGHGAPEIIDPCIRELVDCLNRHGVETHQSCCGHGVGPGQVILAMDTVVPNVVASGEQKGWRLILSPKPIQMPYSYETAEWEDEYPTGGTAWYCMYPNPHPSPGQDE